MNRSKAITEQGATPLLPKEKSFPAYLREKSSLLFIAAGISVAAFFILMYLYPYPDFFVDSHNYIDWAVRKQEISYRPTGYSYLLRFLHAISSAATWTVFVQYFAFFASTLFCLLSTDYLFGLEERLILPLLAAILINPVLLMQTNMISSDSIFGSLTVVWFTTCLWIAKKDSFGLVIAQIVMLFFCLEIRFMAMFYPFVAIAAILFSTAQWTRKAAGIGLTAMVILLVVQREKKIVGHITGTPVFSSFSGWQLANNALYTYKYINIDPTDLPSSEMKVLNDYVKNFIDSVHTTAGDVGCSYIWDKKSPLKQYLVSTSKRTKIPYFLLWFSQSELYNDYGWYIIKTFPGAFVQHYLIPNTKLFFYPAKEAMRDYCDEHPDIVPATRQWFHFPTDTLHTRYPALQKRVIAVFPGISGVINVFNILAIVFFLVRVLPVRKQVPAGWTFFVTWSFFYLSFAVFNIFAAAVNLRFMNPIFVLGFIMPFVLLKYAASYSKIHNKPAPALEPTAQVIAHIPSKRNKAA